MEFDIKLMVGNHQGRTDSYHPEGEKVWAHVRFDPGKVTGFTIEERIDQTRYDASLSSPVIRVYRNTHMQVRVALDSRTYASGSEGKIHVEVTPTSGSRIREFEVRTEESWKARTEKSASAKQVFDKIVEKQIFPLPFILPGEVDKSRQEVVIELSYHAKEDGEVGRKTLALLAVPIPVEQLSESSNR